MRQPISIISVVTALLMFVSPADAQESGRSTEMYHVFDLKTSLGHREMGKILTDGLRPNVSDSQIMTPLVRGALPEKPGTFELVNPFEERRLGGLAALIPGAQLAQLMTAKCDGAAWIANAQRRIRGSQSLRLTMCLFPYTQGYHLDVYAVDTVERGGGLSERLGRALAGAVIGKPEDWTRKTIFDTLRSVRARTGAIITYVEGQPPISGEPWNEARTVLPGSSDKADR